jgi:cell division protein FtsW
MYNRSLTQSIILFVPVILVGLGIMMIYSASSIYAAERFHDGMYFLKKQALFGLCGIGCMLVMMRVPYSFFKRCAYPLWAVSIGLLVLVLIPGIGVRIGGAVRWLHLGPLSFQPAELAKLSVVILLAYCLAKKENERIKEFSIGVLPHLLLVVPLCLLIVMQPDFGTCMMIVAMLFIMLFAAGIRKRFVLGLGAAGLIAAGLLIAAKGYRMERLVTFLNPWKDPTGAGFQIVQSFLAFGSGGFLGTGIGRGTQKLLYLPEPHTDFILAVIGEEMGFIGVIFVIGLFVTIMACGIKIAMNSYDLFGTYLALGIIVLIGLQTVINMGVVMGLLPTKGMPLPFISYGGTALLVDMSCMGILLSISVQCHFMGKA